MSTTPLIYHESFDHGPGGWFGWASNAIGPKELETRDGVLLSRSPWWIDYNHAPPGAGYMHLIAMMLTKGPFSEHQREVAGENRFVQGGFGFDFTNARITLRLKGELLSRGAKFCLLIQSIQNGLCSGWILTGQPFEVTEDWTEQTVVAVPDASQWTCLGGRHDRLDYYGQIDLPQVLRQVNTNILLVLFPLNIVPMGPIEDDLHLLRPEKDYPVWRSELPEGYVLIDDVEIEFAKSA
ncbi:MAG: hypothetical protein U0929_16250 [Planctomycetaceae bacterium]